MGHFIALILLNRYLHFSKSLKSVIQMNTIACNVYFLT